MITYCTKNGNSHKMMPTKETIIHKY